MKAIVFNVCMFLLSCNCVLTVVKYTDMLCYVRDEKHPTRDKWHLMQTMHAWYAFKAHMTVYLEDSVMRDRSLALMDANRIKTKFS